LLGPRRKFWHNTLNQTAAAKHNRSLKVAVRGPVFGPPLYIHTYNSGCFFLRPFKFIVDTSSYHSILYTPNPNQETGSKQIASRALLAGFLIGLFFNPEVGSDMFLRYVGWLSTVYTALCPRR
jgi:hypothetical protein